MAVASYAATITLVVGAAVAQGPILRTIVNTGVYSGSPSGFGSAIAGVGDLDGDSKDDALFGALFADALPFGTFQQGLARVVCGGLATVPFRDHWGLGGEWFGDRVAGGGDINGDGVWDYAVGAPFAPRTIVTSGPGRVQFFSGSAGTLLGSVTGTNPDDMFGSVLAVLDGNDDGYADVIAGTDYALIGGVRTGELRATSGKDGSLLWTLIGSYVTPLTALGDVNGDGAADFSAAFTIRSGMDGSLIRSWTPPIPASFVRIVVASCGDIDIDGVPDFLCGTSSYQGSPAATAGAVSVVSGATGLAIRTHVGASAADQFGYAVAGGFHADGDDVPDYAVRALYPVSTFGLRGSVQIFAGASGALLQTWLTPLQENVGDLANAGDTDGDGTDELLIGSIRSFANPSCPNCGVAYVYQVAAGPAASTRRFGKGCPSSLGRLPTAEAKGRPRIGGAFELRLRAGPINSIAIAFAGTPASADLTPLGAPGCVAHVAPFWSGVVATNAFGLGGFPVAIPSQPSLIGVTFDTQWVVLDPAANALGLVASTAVRTSVGG